MNKRALKRKKGTNKICISDLYSEGNIVALKKKEAQERLGQCGF